MTQTVSMRLTILHSNNLSKRSDALIIKWLNLYKASSLRLSTKWMQRFRYKKAQKKNCKHKLPKRWVKDLEGLHGSIPSTGEPLGCDNDGAVKGENEWHTNRTGGGGGQLHKRTQYTTKMSALRYTVRNYTGSGR